MNHEGERIISFAERKAAREQKEEDVTIQDELSTSGWKPTDRTVTTNLVRGLFETNMDDLGEELLTQRLGGIAGHKVAETIREEEKIRRELYRRYPNGRKVEEPQESTQEPRPPSHLRLVNVQEADSE